MNEILPSPPAANKTPHSDTMANELEELRQRGMAKNLTKHFTQNIKQIQAELASAEEAIQVFEARKENAKKFDPSSNEITQLDMISMRLSEWKKQSRQKEQETVMLYRRYVEKFGGSIKLATPEELTTPQKMPNASPPSQSRLATAELSELVKFFDEAKGENGIPSFLRPSLVIDTSPQTPRALEEILEEESLQDGGDAPCKSLGITPRTVSMDSDEDDEESNSSIVSGLTTLNSHVTKEVLNDAANKVLEFVKHETDHIRKMLAVEEDAKSSSSRRSSAVESISERSATSAENMVLKMQAILDEYKAEAEKNNPSTKPPVRRNDVGNEGEEWYEHWDDRFQRNFYVEKHSNRTQWQIPPTMSEVSSNSSNSVCDSAAGTNSSAASSSMMAPTSPKVMDYTNFKPEAREVRRCTRVRKYRAQCRRQRNRRLAAFAFVVTVAGAAFAYCKQAHPDELERILETASGKVVSTMEWANIAPPEAFIFETSKNNKLLKAKAEAAQKADSKPEPPKAEPVVPVVPEYELKRLVQEVPKTFPREGAALEDIEGGIVVFKEKKAHWVIRFFVALLGPRELPEVERKCRERGSFCGF